MTAKVGVCGDNGKDKGSGEGEDVTGRRLAKRNSFRKECMSLLLLFVHGELQKAIWSDCCCTIKAEVGFTESITEEEAMIIGII